MEYNGEGIEALAALIEEMKRTSIILLDKKVKVNGTICDQRGKKLTFDDVISFMDKEYIICKI